MEYLDIVDEYGNKTGEILDRETAHDLNKLHWEVTVYVVNKNGQLLLEKRSASKRYSPNKWAPCAGHVMSGEEVDVAACRELKEELGLDLPTADLVMMENGLLRRQETNSRIARYFYVICNEGESFLYKDGKWVDMTEAKESLLKRAYQQCTETFASDSALPKIEIKENTFTFDNYPIKAILASDGK